MTLRPVPLRGPWRFLCDHCHDTGWRPVDPSPETMAKLIRLYGDAPVYEQYVVKCDPCKWTQLEREKRRKQLGQDADDDVVTAGTRTRRGRR